MHLAFHATVKRKQPGWQHPLSCSFDRLGWLVKTLQSAGYEIVTCSEYAQRRNKSRAATLSFDDGYRSNLEAAKTLEALGVRGTFFPIACTLRGIVPPNRRLTLAMEAHSDKTIGTWLTKQLEGTSCARLIAGEQWPAPGPFQNDRGLRRRMKTVWNCLLPLQDLLYLSDALKQQFLEEVHEQAACENMFLTANNIRTLASAGHEIGTHTDHHVMLHNQCHENVRLELMRSIDVLTDILRIPITSLCLPYGGNTVPNHLIDVAREFGLCGWNYFEYSAYKDPIITEFGAGFFNRNDHRFFGEMQKAT